MWPIALRTLVADRGKLLTALVGVQPGSLLGSAWNPGDGHLDAIRRADGIVIDDCEGEKLD